MAKVNRHYQPQRAQYVSQFVPDELPAQLMVQGLANRQQKYDQMAAQLAKVRGEWDERSLAGFDTQYVEGMGTRLDEFVGESMQKDLASPQYLQEYTKFITDFQGDEGLKKVRKSVALHDEYLERVKALKEGTATDWDPAFVDQYQRNFAQYTSVGGLGFMGDVQLSDPQILSGVDINTEAEKRFDHLKASGSETMATLASGIAYKNGWTGVDKGRIDDQAKRTLDLFYESRAGQQLQARFKADHIPGGYTYDQYMSRLTPDQRETFNGAMKGYVGQELLNVGKGFIHGKSTTNKDVAMRQQYGYQREDMNNLPQDPFILTSGNTVGWDSPEYTQSMLKWKNNIDLKEQETAKRDKYNRFGKVAEQMSTGKNMSKYVNNMSDEDRAMISGIPGFKQFLDGTMTPVEASAFQEEISQKVFESNMVLNDITIQNKNMGDRLNSAIGSLNPDRKFGPSGYSFSEALEMGESLKNDPVLGQWVSWLEGAGGGIQTPSGDLTPDVDGDFLPWLSNMVGKDPGDRATTWGTDKVIGVMAGMIKDQVQAGTLPSQDAELILKNIDALYAYKDATTYANTALDNKETRGVVADAYNNAGSWQPTATLIPDSESYKAFNLDASGNPISFKTVKRADKMMEGSFHNTPNMWVVYDEKGERILPSDPRYPDPTTVKFGSANLELVDGKAVFNGTGTYTSLINDPKGGTTTSIVDGAEVKGAKKIESEQYGNYTFVASGVDSRQYLDAKKKEAESTIYSDPGYVPGGELYQQGNLSPTGQAALQAYVAYDDSQLVDNTKKMDQMSSGDKYTFTRNMYDPNTGQENIMFYNTVKQDDGSYVLQYKNKDGVNMLGGIGAMRFDNAAQVGSWLFYNEQAHSDLEEKGIRTDPKDIEPTNSGTSFGNPTFTIDADKNKEEVPKHKRSVNYYEMWNQMLNQ